jgi:hypothetical protein
MEYFKENSLNLGANLTSGNEIIDNFIQEKQLKCTGNDTVFEWISYNEFIDIKEMGNSCLATAIWKEGPLNYKIKNRTSYEKVALRYLHDLQNNTDKFINKVLNFSEFNKNICIILIFCILD